ncbi:unnamed protein product [Amoebophrya sp. A25]|nr:unnamed protein product [Amoebophrya sp. A25]|eukprot:GSA25T00002250001.1
MMSSPVAELSRRLGAFLSLIFVSCNTLIIMTPTEVIAQKYAIGDTFMSGAFNITQSALNCTTHSAPCQFNLRTGCFAGKLCPPVVVFEGEISGTIEMNDCDVGVMYSFVNHGSNELGVAVQHIGGKYGAVGVAQYGVGTCFCYTNSKLLCGQR